MTTGWEPNREPWLGSIGQILDGVQSSRRGLSTVQARARLDRTIDRRGGHRRPVLRILLAQFTSPIVLILVVATVVSMALGDVLDGGIIIAIIAASGLLGFWQEFRADSAVAQLLERVQVTVRVLRDGGITTVPVHEVVVGDVIALGAGDVVPADCRLVECTSLLVDESALTGESFPVEKDADARPDATAPLVARLNCVYQGSHVTSGSGLAVAMRTGKDAELGRVTHALQERDVTTSFERGISAFGGLVVRFMLVLTVFIFVVNWIAGRDIVASLLFSLALAVGITPQMLPAIVSLSLSSGARRLAERSVIVKRLDAIEDLGSLTVLCTDKTGTLTRGAARLDAALDVTGAESERVLRLASLNAGLQAAFANPLDDAILARMAVAGGATALAEVPYDFQRKRLSVLTELDGVDTLITKGALDSVLACCDLARSGGQVVALDTVRAQVEARYAQLSTDGFRVVAVATRALDRGTAVDRSDERQLVLEGILAFHDPPKEGAAEAIADLGSLGVSVRLITGDNVRAACAIAFAVGIDASIVLTGPEVERLDDSRLAMRMRDVHVVAEVEPMHKQRIVRALRAAGEVVGFLGDGINDAPALHAADVGLSVDSAVDVAKQASSIVLLEKGLDVVATGVRLGRQTFANTLKYIRLTMSANFGNMLSMAAASLFLSFLPLLPRQILLLNFLSDIPAMAISGDAVDPERLGRPVRWDLRSIRSFMLVFGLLSTVFDLATFALLILVAHADEPVFQGAWFVMSTLTELTVLFSLRTARPFWMSRPARGLVIASLVVAAVTIALPSVPLLAGPLGLEPIPWSIGAGVLALLVLYLTANELLKVAFYRRERAGWAQR